MAVAESHLQMKLLRVFATCMILCVLSLKLPIAGSSHPKSAHTLCVITNGARFAGSITCQKHSEMQAAFPAMAYWDFPDFLIFLRLLFRATIMPSSLRRSL